MEQVVTAKIQIFPDETQKQMLLDSMAAFQLACNYVSSHVYRTKDLSASSLNKKLYHPVRERFGLPSQMAQSVIRAVIAAYRSMKSSGRWEHAGFSQAFTELVWNRDYLLRENVFSVNSLAGRLKVGYTSKGLDAYFDPPVYQFGQAKLLIRKGKFYLHISVKRELPDPDEDGIVNVTGVDRGIHFLANTYDSKGRARFYSGRRVKNRKANYRRLRHELQMLDTRSARRRLKEVSGRENRWMRDVNHCISKALVLGDRDHTLFAIEDLKGIRERVILKGSGRNKEYNSWIAGWSFLDLEEKLRYKAMRHGGIVVKFNPAYTSQTCPRCGHVGRDNRDRKKHLFTCTNCGYRSNDDRVAAMNLHRLGLCYLAHNEVKTVGSE